MTHKERKEFDDFLRALSLRALPHSKLRMVLTDDDVKRMNRERPECTTSWRIGDQYEVYEIPELRLEVFHDS
jgi:hypothetical protein